METFSRRINIYIESGQAEAAQKVLIANQDKLVQKVNDLQGKYKDAIEKNLAAPSKKAADEVKKLGAAVETAKAQLNANTEALDRSNKKVSGELSPSVRDLTSTWQKLNNEVLRGSKQDPGFKKLTEQANDAKAALDKAKQSTGHVSEGLKGMLEGAKGLAVGLGLIVGVEQGLEKLGEFILESIKEFGELQQETRKLKTSLESTGRGGDEAFDALKNSAEKLTKQFAYLTETDISKLQQKLVTFGKLSINQINALTPVIVDYAAKTGKSIDESTDDVIRALEGQGRALKLLGVDMISNGTAAQNYGFIMTDLAARVKNGANDAAAGITGTGNKFQASLKALQDTLGSLFANDYKRFFGLITNTVDGLNSLIKPTEEDTASLEKNRRQLEVNLIALQDVNLSSEARKKLITETNEQYGEYLPHLLTEKTTLDEIKAIQIESNKQLLLKIFATKYQKELNEILEEEAKAREGIVNTQIKQAKLNQNGKDIGLTPAQITQQSKLLQNLGSIGQEIVAGTDKRVTEVKDKYTSIINGLGTKWTDFLNVVNDLSKGTSGVLDKHLKDTNQSQQKELEEFLLNYKAFLDRVDGLRAESEAAKLSPEAKEIQDLKNKRQALLDDLAKLENKALADKVITQQQYDSESATGRLKIEQYFLSASEALEKAQAERLAEDRLAHELTASDKIFAKQKSDLAQQYASGKIGKDAYDKDIEALDAASKDAQVIIFNKYYDDLALKYKDDAKKLSALEAEKTAILQAAADQRAKNAIADKKRLEDALAAQDNADVTTATTANAGTGTNPGGVRDAKLKQLQDEEDTKRIIIGDNLAKINELEAQSAAKRQQINQEYYQAVGAEINKYGSFATQMVSAIFSIEKNIEDAELAEDKKKNDTKKNNLKKQLDSKKITQKQYNDSIAALDSELDKKQAEIKRKQFARDKAAKIIQAVINTASAVISAFGTGGNIYASIALAAVAAATGAAQIAIISSEPVPTFKEGTDQILKGPSHSEGGIDLIDSRTGRKIAEAEGDEAIISGQTTRANVPIIRQLLAAKGKSINTTRAVENIKYAAGAFNIRQPADTLGIDAISVIERANAGGRRPADTLGIDAISVIEITKRLDSLGDRIEKMQSKPVKFVQYDFDRFNKKNDFIYSRTSFGK